MMKKLFLFFFVAHASSAQVLHHQSLASQGSRVVTNKGIVVSQSIGQQSIGGSKVSKNFVIQQGFQQSMFYKGMVTSVTNTLQVKMYPNPVRSVLNFDFSTSLNDLISIAIYDMSGKLIFNDRKKVVSDKLVYDALDYLPVGNYLVSLEGSSFKFSAKFLKIN